KGSNAESMSPINGHEDDEKKVRDLLGSIDASESEVGEMRKKLEAKRHDSFGKALLAGEILCRLKEALKKSKGHGLWQDYVNERFGCSPKKASMYMRFHTRRDELEKSEIFPKLGIAEADDLLKLPKAEELLDASDNGDPAHEDEGSGSEDSLELIDGKKLPLRKVGWAEGLISREGLDRLLSDVVSEDKLSGHPKVAARRQQMIATIASGINRSCGKAEPEQAVEQVRPVLKAILSHLAETLKVKAN
ncbi:MAG: hypothetical protein ACSHX9_00005, partial [Luteolibacter sp.]